MFAGDWLVQVALRQTVECIELDGRIEGAHISLAAVPLLRRWVEAEVAGVVDLVEQLSVWRLVDHKAEVQEALWCHRLDLQAREVLN